uniref:Uncharacterized protein n=1 Tax=Chrysotila carterae TaxID=13221 RepID=A0A7S4F8S4_CHRCT
MTLTTLNLGGSDHTSTHEEIRACLERNVLARRLLRRVGVSEATKKALNELDKGATTLDLSGQGLGPDDILALAKSLKANTSLATLKVHGNHFGPDGIAALGEALKGVGGQPETGNSDIPLQQFPGWRH